MSCSDSSPAAIESVSSASCVSRTSIEIGCAYGVSTLYICEALSSLAAAERLQQGDLLLAIDGTVVTRFREVEREAADKARVKVTVWRGQSEQTFDIARNAPSRVRIA